MIKTIDNVAKINTISYHPEFSVICSIGLSPFHGTMDIVYKPDEKLLEFESFETWLRGISNNHMTIEDLARLVFDNLLAVLGDIPLSVTVHARTTVHAPVSAKLIQGEF